MGRKKGNSKFSKSHKHRRKGRKNRKFKFRGLFKERGGREPAPLSGKDRHRSILPHTFPGRPPVLQKRTSLQHGKLKPIDFRGKRMPGTCNCTLGAKGHGYCYFFLPGSKEHCKRRYCTRKYVCVGYSTGMKCIRRRIFKRVVPISKNMCNQKYVREYMYVPYTVYEH